MLSHLQLSATLCSLPRSSVHGILQAGMLEWVAVSIGILYNNKWKTQKSEELNVWCIWANRPCLLGGKWVAKQSTLWVLINDSKDACLPLSRCWGPLCRSLYCHLGTKMWSSVPSRSFSVNIIMWDTCYGKGEPRSVSSSDLGAVWAGKPSLKQVFKDAKGITIDAEAGRCMRLVLKSYVGQASGERWKQKRRYSMLRSLGFILRAAGSLWMVFKGKCQDVVCY